MRGLAIFALRVIFPGAHFQMRFTHIYIIRRKCCQISLDFTPVNTVKSFWFAGVIRYQESCLCLSVFFVYFRFMAGDFFETDRAHVVFVAMVDVSFVPLHQTFFQGFQSCLRGMVLCQISSAAWFVEDAGFTFDSKIAAKNRKPLY